MNLIKIDRVDPRTLDQVSSYFQGGSVSVSRLGQKDQVEAYWDGYEGTVRCYQEIPKSVIGLYYPVNDQQFPAFVYFVNFYHPKSGSKDHSDNRLNTIVELPIEQTSLNLYIASKFIRVRDNVQPVLVGSQKLSLEGDFGTFYRAYCSDNQQIEALSMLEPNLMLAILQNLGNVAVEIKKNKLFIIIPGFVKDPQALIRLINNCKAVTEQINHNVKGISSQNRHDVQSDDSFKPVSKGLDVKTFLIIAGFIFGIIMFYISISILLSTNNKVIVWVLIPSLMFLALSIIKMKSFSIKRRYIKKYGKNGIY